MDRIVIKGGKKLSGRVKISGSKNSSLPILAATLACHGRVELVGMPSLSDVDCMEHLICSMGVEVKRRKNTTTIEPESLRWSEAPYDIVRKMRASFCVLGPLLARYGEARVSLPGGCAIGIRPVNFHLNALIALGADITTEHGYAVASVKNRLKGAHICLPFPSVGATETAIMAAALAKGKTILENAAQEPEVVDLIGFLNTVGAKIEGGGTSTVTIHGVKELSGGKYHVMADRIEAGTYMVAAAITGGKVDVVGCPARNNKALIDLLREAGVDVACKGNTITISRNGPIKAINRVETQVYPGFPTDLQAQLMTMLTLAEGTSVVQEHIFENRFMHVGELCRMGADITLSGNTATVRGVKKLSGVSVMASDLRASAALVLAGLVASGETEVLRVYHIDRGYEAIEEKLGGLGADIHRMGGKREPFQPFDEPLAVRD